MITIDNTQPDWMRELPGYKKETKLLNRTRLRRKVRKGFDPSEPRDLRGRWTTGGAFVPSTPSDDPAKASEKVTQLITAQTLKNIQLSLASVNRRSGKTVDENTRPVDLLNNELVRRAVKEHGVSRLAEAVSGLQHGYEYGVYSTAVDEIFGSWANTVNLSPQSAVINMAAGLEFGTQESAWQKEQHEHMKNGNFAVSLDTVKKAAEYADKVAEFYTRYWRTTSEYTIKYQQTSDIKEQDALVREFDKRRKELVAEFDKTAEAHGFKPMPRDPTKTLNDIRQMGVFGVKEIDEVGDTVHNDIGIGVNTGIEETRSVLRALYEETQAGLREAGIGPDDKVTLYRGIAISGFPGKEGDVVPYDGNSLESWTSDIATAKDFSSRAEEGQTCVTVAMDFPAKTILSLASSGMGCLSEYEVITMNGFGRGQARVIRVATRGELFAENFN